MSLEFESISERRAFALQRHGRKLAPTSQTTAEFATLPQDIVRRGFPHRSFM